MATYLNSGPTVMTLYNLLGAACSMPVVVYTLMKSDRDENRPRTDGRRMIERWLYRRRR